MPSTLQVQSDIAVTVRESEAQQQLLNELQAPPLSPPPSPLCCRPASRRVHNRPHRDSFVSQGQKEALEAALSGEGLRQLQAEIDALRDKGKAAGGNVM